MDVFINKKTFFRSVLNTDFEKCSRNNNDSNDHDNNDDEASKMSINLINISTSSK